MIIRHTLPLVLALFLLALSGTGTGCSRKPGSEPAPTPPPMRGGPVSTPMVVPPLRCPRVHAADDAKLADDDRVVGVVAGGKARAYLLSVLSTMRYHVVNDLLGDVPVSVTVCDRTECVRTFTDKSRGKPLEMSQMGYHNGLLLRIGSGVYRQSTGEATRPGDPALPYRTTEHQVTTWKKWREAHPDTEVFTGK